MPASHIVNTYIYTYTHTFKVFEAWQEGLPPPTTATTPVSPNDNDDNHSPARAATAAAAAASPSSSSGSSCFPSRRVALKVLRPVPGWRVEREVGG